MAADFNFSFSQLYRKMSGKKRPLGWPADQELMLLIMRQMFRYGNVQHWRSVIGSATSKEVPGLLLTRVPGSTFKGSGWRDSWWVELPPEQCPEQPKASLVLLYLHGGGFVSGDPLMYCPTFKTWMQRLAEQGIHLRVFTVGYPLAPEQRFPSGLLGAVAAYDWLVQQLGGSECIVLGGDSAGGNLSIAALEYMRQRAAGCIEPALTAAAAAAAAATAEAPADQGCAKINSSNGSSSSSAAVPFHPPAAALLVSPAVDLSSSSVFGLPEAEAAKLFRYDYVAKSEAADAGAAGCCTAAEPTGVTRVPSRV
ncbi:hypothetical protein OEZ86_001087 [Tetradesmus obliquus]|nr:hypothetical protein OEZ86_001087 [Tetradesmus obliquus]